MINQRRSRLEAEPTSRLGSLLFNDSLEALDELQLGGPEF